MSSEILKNDVVIVAGARTPIGGFEGVFSSLTAPELGAVAIRHAMERSGVSSDEVDEVVFGNVLGAGVRQAPARQAALGAGLDLTANCTTINKMCGSGMKAFMIAHDQLKAGSCKIAVAGGMESMTQSPYLMLNARSGMRMGHGTTKDHMFYDGLEDAYTGRSMGSFAQDVADKFGLTREQMDAFALESLKRAKAAIETGAFDDETAPVVVKSRTSEIEVNVDEQPGAARPEKIPSLRPSFAKDGTITAANASSISDGAAALVLMTYSKAKEMGLKPMARVVSHSSHAQDPSEFSLAPIESIRKVLKLADWSSGDVDLFEINEAFASVTMMAMHELGLEHEKVNVNGGACALGHPIGASGARILVTLMYALRRIGGSKGVASLCIGGGEATSVAIEMM